MGFIRMKHPDIEVLSQEVTEEAFEHVHRHKGWQRATEEEINRASRDSEEIARRGTDTPDGEGTTSPVASPSKRKGS